MNTFGLDIGSNSIKLIKLARLADKYKLQFFGIAPTPANVLFSESESDVILLAETIKKLVNDTKVDTNEAVIALPESRVISTIIEMPPLSETELAEAIKWEAEQYIPQPLSEVKLAWNIVEMPKKGETGVKMKVLLISAPIRLIDRYTRILSLANLKPVSLETEMLAILRSLEADLMDMPTIVINLGASATHLAIVYHGSLFFTRSIGTGGSALAKAVASELGLEISQAEEYKKSYGLNEASLEGKVTAAIKPIFTVITEEIRKALAFFKEKTKDELVNRAILTGGTARLPGIVSYFAQELSLEVLVGNPWVKVILDPLMAKEISDDGNLYAGAVGLAMKDL